MFIDKEKGSVNMWKKVMVCCCALIGSFTIGFAYYNLKMTAGSSAYQVGAEATVKLGTKGVFPNGSNGAMSKGDKIYVGTNNYITGEPLSFMLLVKETYNTYQPVVTDEIYSLDLSVPNVSGWFMMGNEAITNTSYFSAYPTMTPTGHGIYYYPMNYLTTNEVSNIAEILKQSNNNISGKTKSMLLSRNLKHLKAMSDKRAKNWAIGRTVEEALHMAELNPQSFFIADSYTLENRYGGDGNMYANEGYGFGTKDIAFTEDYWEARATTPNNNRTLLNILYYGSNGSRLTDTSCTQGATNGCGVEKAIRLSAEMNLDLSGEMKSDNVVFATGMGSGSTFSKVKNSSPNLGSYSNIYTATSDYDKLKLRFLDSSNAHSVSFLDVKNSNFESKTKVGKNATIYIDATATAGTQDGAINTVSALFFKNNVLAYYVPLGTANGTQQYELDLTGFDVGSYKIALVNESYNEGSMDPTTSSALTAFRDLTITEPLSNLTFTPRTNLKLNENVNVGDTVGVVSSQNGAGDITYSIAADPAYPQEYQNFEMANDGTTVIVKGSALNAGVYHFKIQAQDENGDPKPALTIDAQITVNKNLLAVAFQDTAQTTKSIAQAQAGWSEVAIATPNTGVALTYSIISTQGNISTGNISINSQTGAISYTGNGAFGKITIQVSADDDPASGYDNYDSVTATKEVVIYRDVDGNVTPDAQSKDPNTPTFHANEPNVKANGKIGVLQGMYGTPDDGVSGKTTYHYEIKQEGDYASFVIDATKGEIKSKVNLGVKEHKITLIVSDKWSSKEIPLTIKVEQANAENLQFYENASSATVITTKTVQFTETNVSVYATVKGSSNANPVMYRLKSGEAQNVIDVNQTSGGITIKGAGTVIIEATKQGSSGQADARAELTFTVAAGAQNFIYTDHAGNELPKTGTIYSAKTETYAPNKTFQLYTAGNPTGSTVSYQLKAGAPNDVISVDTNGLVTILNATQSSQMGKVVVEAVSHDSTGNYADKKIELPINIDKGTRTISFVENPIYAVSGKGKVTPVTEVDGVLDADGDVMIEVDSNEDHRIAWTNDNKTIDYNYSGDSGKDIIIHATKPMNRNYKLAETDGVLHIMGPDESMLAITSPGQIVYGDCFTIKSTQYDSDSTNVNYTFETDKSTYISNPVVNGNSAEFNALKASGNDKTTVTVTRTADGEAPLSKKLQITVLPKEIEIVIDDKEKLKGEVNPSLTYQDYKSELISWNGIQDVIQENDVKLSTTAKTDSDAGGYAIKGDSAILNKTYPNYSFKFKEGTLTIKEDVIEDDWYHLELDDGTAYTGKWTNQAVNIFSDHNEYINLSLDQSSWNPSQVTVTKEGETNQSFWMKKESGATTKEKQVLIKIDKTPPKVKGIKAKDTNNKLQDIINKLSGGIFFKPGTSFEITTSDTKDDLKVSGTKEISYKIYKLDTVARTAEEMIKEGTLSVTKEKASITISETTGRYKVCIIPTDNAGNTNAESCHEVELKKIDVDMDKDGKPDFNDPDGDGCPDLNIKWKDPTDTKKWIVINGDRDYDGIPDLNIDSDGDGIPDLNIDTDKDGKPDLNLVVLKKADWKPTKCVKADPDNNILEEYCTGTNVKALINVDTDNNGIPNINIDNNGEMKADINISKDSINPIINIADIHKWEPIHDYKAGITYDSVGVDQEEYDRKVNIDTDGDGRPDVNVDLDQDGKPDINIDLDGDEIPDIDIDSDGDGLPDINVDLDGDGTPDKNIKEITEWKPNKNIDGDFPYDTMEFVEALKDDTKPDVPSKDSIKPSVKGYYNSATSIGGANTGDHSDSVLIIEMLLLSLFTLLFLSFKSKYHNEKRT